MEDLQEQEKEIIIYKQKGRKKIMTREMIMNELRNRGYEVAKSDVVKNGVLFTGITLGDGTIRPTIYVDTYLDRNDLDAVVDEIENIYDRSLIETPVFAISELMNWNYAKTHLQLCLQKKGDEDIVKQKFLDLEQYVRVIVTNTDDDGCASFKVKPEHLMHFNISESELFEAAMECMRENILIEDMLDIIAEMMPDMDIEDLREMSKGTPQQIVITNKNKLNGASSICDMETLSQIADKHESDLAILPSSIHECILIPVEDNTNFIEFDAMIQDVNKTQVAPEEVLSNHAYRFNRDEKRITYYNREETIANMSKKAKFGMMSLEDRMKNILNWASKQDLMTQLKVDTVKDMYTEYKRFGVSYEQITELFEEWEKDM